MYQSCFERLSYTVGQTVPLTSAFRPLGQTFCFDVGLIERIMDTSPTGQFTYYLDISPTRLVFAEYNIGYGVARLGEKAPVVLFLAAIGALNKFGFDTWLRFGLLFTALATTLGNL